MPSPKTAAKARGGGGPVKAPQLCRVTVGYLDLVMPVDKGLALVGLLKDATSVGYVGDSQATLLTYRPRDPLDIALEILKPGQFVPAEPTLH